MPRQAFLKTVPLSLQIDILLRYQSGASAQDIRNWLVKQPEVGTNVTVAQVDRYCVRECQPALSKLPKPQSEPSELSIAIEQTDVTSDKGALLEPTASSQQVAYLLVIDLLEHYRNISEMLKQTPSTNGFKALVSGFDSLMRALQAFTWLSQDERNEIAAATLEAVGDG